MNTAVNAGEPSSPVGGRRGSYNGVSHGDLPVPVPSHERDVMRPKAKLAGVSLTLPADDCYIIAIGGIAEGAASELYLQFRDPSALALNTVVRANAPEDVCALAASSSRLAPVRDHLDLVCGGIDIVVRAEPNAAARVQVHFAAVWNSGIPVIVAQYVTLVKQLHPGRSLHINFRPASSVPSSVVEATLRSIRACNY